LICRNHHPQENFGMMIVESGSLYDYNGFCNDVDVEYFELGDRIDVVDVAW
jgi:hypothetical protein